MTEEKHETPPDYALKEIEARLQALKRDTSESPSSSSDDSFSVSRMMWLAFNIVSDLIAGVVCGFGIGYGLDKWLGTRPVFIAVFLILGSMAGVLNVIRFLRLYDERQNEKISVFPKEKE